MLYSEYMIKAKEEVIEQADNGLWYLDPDWQFNLTLAELVPNSVADFSLDWNIVKDSLMLEIEKRNTINSVKPFVLAWFNSVISSVIEPTMLEEETDYVKILTEYLKTKNDKNELK